MTDYPKPYRVYIHRDALNKKVPGVDASDGTDHRGVDVEFEYVRADIADAMLEALKVAHTHVSPVMQPNLYQTMGIAIDMAEAQWGGAR